MKKDFETYLYDVGQNVSMTSLEKEAIFSHLKKSIEASQPKVESPYFRHFFQYQRIAGFAFMFVFLIGGVTSVSAEYSFPGDPLYLFKIGVNEEVRGWFSQTPIAKAEWSIRLAERRLYELESMEDSAKLSLAEQQSLEEVFALQVEKAERNTREYEFEAEKTEIIYATDVEPVASASLKSEEPAEIFSTATFSQETSSLRSKTLEQNKDVREATVQNDEPDRNQIISQIKDLKDRVRSLRKSLRNAKDIPNLDKGKLLRLEARLLQTQRSLIALEKSENPSTGEEVVSLTRRILEIEQSLDSIIPSTTEKTTSGEVLGGLIEVKTEDTDSDLKKVDEKREEDVKASSEEKTIEIKNTISNTEL